MRIDVLTVLPEMFEGPISCSIVKRAQERGLVDIRLHNLRDFTDDRHRTTDDAPYGGGAGMVMKIEPIYRALCHIEAERGEGLAILMSPQGQVFGQRQARDLAAQSCLTLICGHYEGIDDRIREVVPGLTELSIGDYVLTGGEIPAMVVMDSVIRLLPGALGDEDSAAGDSFSEGLLEYPQYTRPADFLGRKVPEILLSGNHRAVDRWRREQSLRRTWERRPNLLKNATLSEEERRQVARWEAEAAPKEATADVADY
ncbi:MAG: tRNA (guanosine(37)-N1)-methyltransferase TrmD [Armatimonadetes bacterium]|nr:tRNA (guanosine(37)-N1)-methyltransferase TrmD [Armatimonadota bacterium]